MPFFDSAPDQCAGQRLQLQLQLQLALIGASIVSASAFAGCASRQVPHNFVGPMIGGVHAAVPVAPQPATKKNEPPKEHRAQVAKRKSRPAAPGSRQNLAATESEPQRSNLSIGGSSLEAAPRKKDVLDPLVDAPLSDVLRGLVGRRDKKRSHSRFALDALGSLGLSLDSDRELAAIDIGRDLVRVASARFAVSSQKSALLGDLVVFDRVVASLPASLVGVVVGQRGDGSIEFIYLARGVVRRGWVNPLRPNEKRDGKGKILNTFVRHSDGGDRSGTRYFAGHLFTKIIRLNRLLNP